MLNFGIVLAGAAMIAHGWWQAGLAEGKATGWLTGAAGLALGLAVLSPSAVFAASATPVPVGTQLLLWGIYALLVTAATFGEYGTRALGFYAAFLSVASVLFVVGYVTQPNLAGIAVSGIQAAAFFLLFLQLAPPLNALSRVVAWIFVVAGAAVALVGFGGLLGLVR